MGANDPTTPGFDTLQALIASARGLVDQLMAEPLSGRVLAVFSMLPEADREPILRVLERDATWRRIVDETSGGSGITVRPNPHASLYLHVTEPVESQLGDGAPTQRDLDMIRLGIARFVRLFPLFFQEGVHAQWTESARELIRGADSELRALGTRLAREVLALIAEVETEGDPKRPK
jgi:hypothetical protein